MTDTNAPKHEFDWENGDDAFPRDHVPLVADSRTEARICAIQVLYSADLRRVDVREAVADFPNNRLKKRKADKKLFELICADAAEGAARYETLIMAQLRPEWPWERMDLVMRAILRAAAAELTAHATLPVAVIVDEYVNIAKGFLAPDQVPFVHSVIDRMAKVVRG